MQFCFVAFFCSWKCLVTPFCNLSFLTQPFDYNYDLLQLWFVSVLANNIIILVLKVTREIAKPFKHIKMSWKGQIFIEMVYLQIIAILYCLFCPLYSSLLESQLFPSVDSPTTDDYQSSPFILWQYQEWRVPLCSTKLLVFPRRQRVFSAV